MLLDLHSSTFHNCTPNRIGLADSLAERERQRERETLCPVSSVYQSRYRRTHGIRTSDFEFKISAGRAVKIKATKRSSGHARAEIRRRYAIAWVEYIDLSRPRPPRSHRRRRHYRRLVVSLNFSSSLRTQLCLRLWKTLVSRSRELHFNSDSPLSASRSHDIRAEHYCPWYWRCRPCYTRTSRIDPRGIYPYPRLWPVDDIMPRDGSSYHQNFFSLVVSKRYRGTPFPRTYYL